MGTNYSRTQWRQRYTETRSIHLTMVESTRERRFIEGTVTEVYQKTVRPTEWYLSTVRAEETKEIRQATVEAILTESSK